MSCFSLSQRVTRPIQNNRFTQLLLRRTLGTRKTSSRGARGHGWYLKYKTGRGGRHLQGEYWDRDSLLECQQWNDTILQLGSTKCFLDIVAEPKLSVAAEAVRGKYGPPVPKLDSLTGERKRLELELASAVMPSVAQNFVDLLPKFKGTRLYRFEKEVGIKGGDWLTNSGKVGRAAGAADLFLDVTEDPLVLWHIPGTVSMICKHVDRVDSRFLLVTKLAQHMDGIHRACGMLTPESLEIVQNWHGSLLTRFGIPTAVDLVVADCGLVEDHQEETAHTKAKTQASGLVNMS